ncbi:MAG: hypothetical protein RL757_2403 [Bacteroidota bacterium]|jgi:hypothetical protein
MLIIVQKKICFLCFFTKHIVKIRLFLHLYWGEAIFNRIILFIFRFVFR